MVGTKNGDLNGYRFKKAEKSGGNCCCGSGAVKTWIGARCEQSTETRDNAQNVTNQSRPLRSRLVDGNAQMREESAKSAFIGTWRRSSRGNAWHARPGNRKMHSWQNMQVHKPHFIVFVRRASKHNCAVFATLAKPNRNLRPRRGNGHAMAVECVWIVRGKLGAGGDAVYAT